MQLASCLALVRNPKYVVHPVNADVPSMGTVIEVRYLYTGAGGHLYQPCYLGPRDDLGELACLMSQVKSREGLEDLA